MLKCCRCIWLQVQVAIRRWHTGGQAATVAMAGPAAAGAGAAAAAAPTCRSPTLSVFTPKKPVARVLGSVEPLSSMMDAAGGQGAGGQEDG
jgi:hypothetical protein